MDKSLFFALFSVLALIYCALAYSISRKTKTLDDYFLAGRTLTVFQLVLSLMATHLGAGFILGTSREAYYTGYYGLLYALGACIGLALLACGVASKLRNLQVETTAQIFQTHYNSPTLKHVASLCSIISLVGIFVAQVVGSKALFLSLGVYNPIIFIVVWLAVISYAMIGGFKALVQNDILQLTVIILLFCTVFFYDSFCQAPGFINVLSSGLGTLNTRTPITLDKMATIILMPALYSLIEQDLAQIFFAASTARKARIAACYAGLGLLGFALIPVYFGIKARLLSIPINHEANPLLVLFDTTYSSILVTFIAYGIVAAIISSANGILCAISSNIVQDFAVTFVDKKHHIILSKLVMLAVGITGVGLAFYCSDIIHVLVSSYAVPVTALLVPLLMAYFSYNKSQLSSYAAYASVCTGLGVFLFSKITGLYYSTGEIDALIASAAGYALGYSLEKNKVIKTVTR